MSCILPMGKRIKKHNRIPREMLKTLTSDKEYNWRKTTHVSTTTFINQDIISSLCLI